MARLVLWLLNRCADWDPEPLARALSVKSAHTNAKRHDVVFMQRANLKVRGASANAANARIGKPAELALEGASWGSLRERDEYFVPIPIKVFGDPERWSQSSSSVAASFKPIRERYQHWFDGKTEADRWQSWWSTARTELFPFQVGMNTADGVGYYDVLRAASTEIKGAQNVLVGYSQAGLTSRYLAYVDRQVAREDLVAGTITCHTPNYGSPVARPDNADAVLDAVGKAIVSVLGLTSPPFPAAHAFLITNIINKKVLSVDLFCGLLEAAIRDLDAMGAAAAKQYAAQGDAVTSALKWLSGLRGGGLREKFAFYDLSSGHLDGEEHAHTVLGALRRWQCPLAHGAVVGTNQRLEDLVFSSVSSSLLPSSPLPSVLLQDPLRALAGPLRAALATAGACYSDALVEAPLEGQAALAPLPPELDRKRRQYLEGVTVDAPKSLGKPARVDVPARAHDFVVPACYQIIESGSAQFLGNALNFDANHMSGATGTDGRPPTTRDLVEQMLAKMGEALPA